MRKKTMSKFFDNIMWYLIYLLPIIAYLIYCANVGSFVLFADFVANIGFMPTDTNIVYNSLYNLFGTGGILPLFSDASLFVYMTYFVCVFIIHIVVDFILFIPRLAHKYMKIFYQEED